MGVSRIGRINGPGSDPASVPVHEKPVSGVEKFNEINTSCMSVEEALKLYESSLVYKAVEKELKNMLDMKVFKRLSRHELAELSPKVVMGSKFFLKDKGVMANLIELKGRMVAGGHRQDITIYERKSSPTVGAPTIYVVMIDAAAHGKHIIVMDVPCAYLHAGRDGLPRIFLRIDPIIAKEFLKLAPEYAVCLDGDGSLVVEVMKGLYGLIESGFTWFNHLSKFLMGIGFTSIKMDSGVVQDTKERAGESGILVVPDEGTEHEHSYVTISDVKTCEDSDANNDYVVAEVNEE